MIFGFPRAMISELRCTQDGAVLQLDSAAKTSPDGGFVMRSEIRCAECRAVFTINDGILNMLNTSALDNESRHEQQLRDEQAWSVDAVAAAWYEDEHNAVEVIPTIEALSVNRESTLLELGCGDGRFTVALARQCRSILAIDFSVESLRVLQHRLQDRQNVGLVLGDVTHMKLAAGRFDRVLSTLVSNLPTREHRDAMYGVAAHW